MCHPRQRSDSARVVELCEFVADGALVVHAKRRVPVVRDAHHKRAPHRHQQARWRAPAAPKIPRRRHQSGDLGIGCSPIKGNTRSQSAESTCAVSMPSSRLAVVHPVVATMEASKVVARQDVHEGYRPVGWANVPPRIRFHQWCSCRLGPGSAGCLVLAQWSLNHWALLEIHRGGCMTEG